MALGSPPILYPRGQSPNPEQHIFLPADACCVDPKCLPLEAAVWHEALIPLRIHFVTACIESNPIPCLLLPSNLDHSWFFTLFGCWGSYCLYTFFRTKSSI
uniref:Uncharacterized protein n=1 Tax=Physcomitrium patens TaxID=3218 RepID=A0A7I3ZFH2_PHYPA